MSSNQFEVHDPVILSWAREVLDACATPTGMQQTVLYAVNVTKPSAATSASASWLLGIHQPYRSSLAGQ